MPNSRRTTTCLAIAAVLAGCGDAGERAENVGQAPPAAPAETAAPATRTDPLVADTGVSANPADSVLSIEFERRGEGTYAVTGRTSASTLEVSVEDGHNVLYGPERVAVSGGAFRTEVAIAATSRPTVYAYITEPGGSRQWVVPIPLNQPRVSWTGGVEPGAPAGGN
jgi:hypothetical protein